MSLEDNFRGLFDSPSEPFQIEPDFEPLYASDSVTYQHIVNRFVNLTSITIHVLQTLRDEESAKLIAVQASEALRDYNEDLAEPMRFEGNLDYLRPGEYESDAETLARACTLTSRCVRLGLAWQETPLGGSAFGIADISYRSCLQKSLRRFCESTTVLEGSMESE